MGSHSITCHPTQVNTSRLNPSHAGWYSIYLPRWDWRLSWPSALAVSQTSDLLITSPMPNHCTTKTRMRGKAQPDGRPAVELIETLVLVPLFCSCGLKCMYVHQSSQQAEICNLALIRPRPRRQRISVLPSPLPISRQTESTSRIVCLYKRFNGLRIMSHALTLNSNFVITMDSTAKLWLDWAEFNALPNTVILCVVWFAC